MSIFNGRAVDIEDNRNKTQVIDENSTDIQYPSAKAVFESQKVLREELTNQNDMVANALKGAASGTSVCMKDVSPLQHDIKVKLSGEGAVGRGFKKGEFIGTSTIIYDESLSNAPWQNVNFESEISFSPYIAYVDNRTDLYANIQPLLSGWAMLLVTDGTVYRNFRICDENGGEIYSEINNGEMTISFNGTDVMKYPVEPNAKIIGVSRYGGGPQTELDIYACEFNSGVKLYKGGINMLDLSTTKPTHNNDTNYVRNGNSFTLKGNVGTGANNYDAGQLMIPLASTSTIPSQGISVKKGKTYTVSFDYTLIEKGKYSTLIRLLIYKPNLTVMHQEDRSTLVGKTARHSVTFTATEDTKIGLTFRINNNYVTISNIQIEEGSAKTEFEPYIEPTECVVNTDGTANVPSLYPTTRLYTDTEGVTIEAEYNRDINKAFASLTNALISLGGNV